MENITSLPHERQKLQLTQNGGIKSNSANNVLVALLEDYQTNSSLRYNEFNEDWEIIQPMTLGDTKFEVGEVPSDFESVLSVYLERALDVVFTTSAIKQGLEVFFSQKKYNPAKEYMEECLKNWDGKTRINSLFQDYLGAENTEIVRSIENIFMVGAVKKVYEPDFKFDYVLDLVGGQGIGKTSILQKLGGMWYTDSITDFSNKDNFELMIRSLLVNDDEMVASKKMGFAELKAFVTKVKLRFRKAYARRSQEYPKKFVLARTTNEVAYLRDKTGDRRFLPVMVGLQKQKSRPWDMTDELISQIWGEAMVLYKGAYPTSFTEEEEVKLEEYRQQFVYVDEIENLLDEFLEMPVPEDWENEDKVKREIYTKNYFDGRKTDGTVKQNRVATRDILSMVFDSDAKNQKLSKKINYFMSNKKDWSNGFFRIKGKNTRGFIREK